MISVVDRPISTEEVIRAVEHPGAGGVVSFTGTVRDRTRGRDVVRLEYEAYVPMAEKVLGAVAAEIAEAWPGTRTAILHRVGVLEPGEAAVCIAVSAPHRDAAFQGCRRAIERLKEDAPIWKREVYSDGTEWIGLGP